jgi:regulator of sigma E protease
MGSAWITAAQLVLSLSILIVLHECGHFFPAKWFSTRVEKFYLFFNPYFELFKFKRGETEYGIGWLPLGGYVKIAGMVDESMDKEQMALPPQPWEFRSKPAWQRLIIMIGGVTVNFILGFLLYAMVFYVWGERYMPNANIKYGIQVDSLGRSLGLQNGDKILSIGDKAFTKFNPGILTKEIVLNNARSLQVQRNGAKITLPIDPMYVSELAAYKNKGSMLFAPRFPFVVGGFTPTSPAKKAGMQENDVIIALNDKPVVFFDDFQAAIKGRANEDMRVKVLRNNLTSHKIDTVSLTVHTTDKAKMEIAPYGDDLFFKTERQSFTLAESLPAGFASCIDFLDIQFKSFGLMFGGKIKASESLGGFASIAGLFGDYWNWERFWKVTAMLSIMLGFMNLLPIPALDGGYVMFLLFEVLTGKRVSDAFMERAVTFGFMLMLGLTIYANGLDAFRFFQK